MKGVTTKRVSYALGLLWAVLGNAERIVAFVSGATVEDTEGAVSNIGSFFDALPLLGNESAQILMSTGGLILLSVALGLTLVGWSSKKTAEGVKEGKVRIPSIGKINIDGQDLPRATLGELCEPYIASRTVYLADVPHCQQSLCVVHKKTFEDCCILGPAIVRFDGGVLNSCELCHETEDPSVMFWRVFKNRPQQTGFIDFKHCVFTNCKFVGVGIVSFDIKDSLKKYGDMFVRVALEQVKPSDMSG